MKNHSNLYYIFQWDSQRNSCPLEMVERMRKVLIALLL